MSDIFISYKREEQPVARTLANALEKAGWTVWWDPKLRAGEHFDDVIEEALLAARCVVVLWSRKSVKSRYVKDEATYALKRDKLVPVAIEEVDLPFRFEGLHTERLTAWEDIETDPVYQKLSSDIAAILGEPPSGYGSEHDSFRSAGEGKSAPLIETAKPVVGPQPGDLFRDSLEDGSEGPEMVVIPAGEFMMGSPEEDEESYEDEQPEHRVTIAHAFAIGRYPVTFEEYDRFAEATAHELPDDEKWGREQRPVINVSWEDAVAYIKWLSGQTGKRYRLPSEAEWEYAARGGNQQENWAGTSSKSKLKDYAWYDKNSGDMTHPVGDKSSNVFGLYDMSGNVWEWVQDCRHDDYEGAPANGSAWLGGGGGDCDLRVLRGGSWGNEPRIVRSAVRDRYVPGIRDLYLGFRLAQDL